MCSILVKTWKKWYPIYEFRRGKIDNMKKGKKVIAYIVLFVLLVMSIGGMEVKAEDYVPHDMRTIENITTYEDRQVAKEEAYKMEVQSNTWENWPIGPETYGEAAIVMEAESGAILYAKNIEGQGYPASITKVLTLLTALENGNMEDTITVTQEALDCLGGGYAHIGLKAGEELTLENILYAVMLASANEAAYSVASSLGEGYEAFIEEMNTRMKELGGTRSNFTNTNGVHDDNHYTTAKEMALVTQELLLNHPEFEQICQTLQYTIGPTNLTTESRTFQQKHKMLLESSEYYDSRVIAGKTGYTDYALNTLITCAKDENLKLIVVNLKTYEGALYPDTTNLLNYGFDNFEKISISEEEIESDIVSVAEDSYIVVPKGVTLDDLEQTLVNASNGNNNATVIYTYNGQNVGNVNVTVSKEVMPVKEEQKETQKTGWTLIKKIVIVCIVLALILVLYMTAIIIIRYKKKVERQRRRERKRRRIIELERERQRQMRRRNKNRRR